MNKCFTNQFDCQSLYFCFEVCVHVSSVKSQPFTTNVKSRQWLLVCQQTLIYLSAACNVTVTHDECALCNRLQYA